MYMRVLKCAQTYITRTAGMGLVTLDCSFSVKGRTFEWVNCFDEERRKEVIDAITQETCINRLSREEFKELIV